ncbi:carotenoid oxygenase family protein [Streptomyces sp. NBC_00063]|uniref:carotenoid oxygenase family protein n=1 Tax=Streptomyces sp. NBC_00063 TaxID=2975638 RepID=UPI003D7492A5
MTSTRLDDLPQEFPRVNEFLVSRRHRFACTAGAAEMRRAYETVDGVPPDDRFTNCLVKHDMLRGSRQVHRFPNGAAAGEAVFVPRRGARDEDDGYLVSASTGAGCRTRERRHPRGGHALCPTVSRLAWRCARVSETVDVQASEG